MIGSEGHEEILGEMKIGDTVSVLIEIEPPCSCTHYRGDEIMTCAAHGLPDYKQLPTQKIKNGTVVGFCSATSFSPQTVIVKCGVGGNLQFETETRELFMTQSATGNILSMKLLFNKIL